MSQHKRFPPLKLLSLVFCHSDERLTNISPKHCFACMIHIFVIHFLVQLSIYTFSFYLFHWLTYTSLFSFGGNVYMCKYGGQRSPQVSSQLTLDLLL